MSAPELHRPVTVDRLVAGSEHLVEAAGPELAALAQRLGVAAVLSLSCRFRLTPAPGGVVLAEGVLRARLVRDCVVSLEPFEAETAETFRLRFVPAASFVEPDEAALLDPDSDDELPYEAGVIDLGEAAAEQLALALDPYPRRPGASLPDAAPETPASPFAALASRLRRDQN